MPPITTATPASRARILARTQKIPFMTSANTPATDSKIEVSVDVDRWVFSACDSRVSALVPDSVLCEVLDLRRSEDLLLDEEDPESCDAVFCDDVFFDDAEAWEEESDVSMKSSLPVSRQFAVSARSNSWRSFPITWRVR